MVNEFVVTAVGTDRPGIVAALTGALLTIGGNLEDARAALMRGSFATILSVAVPPDVHAEQVRGALEPVARDLGLGLWIGDAAPPPTGPPKARCLVSVYGADHPGIVHGIADALARHEINVIDLSARLVGDPPVYVLGIEVEPPAGVNAAAVRAALAPAAEQHGVELTVDDEGDEVL